jgi:hypothetical protein
MSKAVRRALMGSTAACAITLLFSIAWRFSSPQYSGAIASEVKEPSAVTVTEPTDTDELTFAEISADVGSKKGLVEHRFYYRNSTEHVITIEGFEPSCSCTLVKPEQMRLYSGKSGSFTVKVDLSKQARGFHRFSVVMKYNGLAVHRKRLELIVRHDPDAYLTSSVVKLSGVVGDPIREQVAFVDTRDQAPQLVALRQLSSMFNVEVIRKPETYVSGWKTTLEISPRDPGLPPGDYFEVLNLDVDPPPPAPISLRVELHLTARAHARPSVAVLSESDVLSKGASKKIELQDLRGNGSAIAIEKVECDSALIEWRVLSGNSNRGPILEIGLAAGVKIADSKTTRIRIKLRSPCAQELVILVLLR